MLLASLPAVHPSPQLFHVFCIICILGKFHFVGVIGKFGIKRVLIRFSNVCVVICLKLCKRSIEQICVGLVFWHGDIHSRCIIRGRGGNNFEARWERILG